MSEIFLNWGDSNQQNITLSGSNSVNIQHDYANNSGYTIKISGQTDKITEMILSGSNITQISGFTDNKIEIETLNLNNNKINEFPDINNNLKNLYLESNKFSGGTTGTVSDYDGNIYQTVIIGNQEWMTENLKTTHYADGTPIDYITGSTTELLTTGCVWVNSPTTPYSSFSSSGLVINSASSSNSTLSCCYLQTNTPTTYIENLKIDFTISSGNYNNFPRLIITDENNTEFLNTEIPSAYVEFNISITGSTGKFTLWLYNTDQNKSNPYYVNFQTFQNLYIYGSTGWKSYMKGAYCCYNNIESNKNIYGLLYNWNAVNNPHGLSPTGWRVPSDRDFSNLSFFIGNDNISGKFLKETGSTYWNSSNTGTNNYGFNLRGGGYRVTEGNFFNNGSNAYLWTSLKYNHRNSKYIYISSNYDTINRTYTFFDYGMSVRCVRDISIPITNKYSGSTLETLDLSNNTVSIYNSNSFPNTLRNFSANNTFLDSNSINNIVEDMYNNSSDKSGMNLSLINSIGSLDDPTKKYILNDYSGSTIKTVGKFQLLFDRTKPNSTQSLLLKPFVVNLTKPITQNDYSIYVDWGDSVYESYQFYSGSTLLLLSHNYESAFSGVCNIYTHWDVISELNTYGSYYDNLPINIKEFVGLKKLDIYDITNSSKPSNNGNKFSGILDLSRNNLLEYIDISFNNYTSLIWPKDLSHITYLHTTSCNGVNVPNLNLMDNLNYFDISSTPNISGSLNNPSSNKITYFRCSLNSTLSAGPIPTFTNCTGMTSLIVNNSNRNSIGDTDFTTLKSLQTLYLSNNTYDLSPFFPNINNLTNLNTIYCSYTGLKSIGDTDWSTLSGLTYFSMVYNASLSGLTPNISSTGLTRYEISSNKFYGNLRSDFRLFPNLTYIDVSYNNNSQTPGFGINGSFPDLSNCTGLTYLKLDNCKFNSHSFFDNMVYAISVDNSGRTYVGGNFTQYSGVTQQRLTRLSINGTRDTTFDIGTTYNDSGFNSTVNCISTDLSGNSYISGNFTTFRGSSQNYLVKLKEDGSVDTSFNIGTGFNNSVSCTTIESNGKLYVGGNFTQYSGITKNYILRLNTDGSLDTSFTGTTNGSITSIKLDSINDKIYIIGSFTTVNSINCKYLARLNTDGSLDTSFNVNNVFNAPSVRCIDLDSSGRCYVGGDFTYYNSTPQNYISRLNSDGSLDTSFNIGSGFDNHVNTILVNGDKIYIGGNFTQYSGITQKYSIVLNMDGSINDESQSFYTNNVVNYLYKDTINNKIYMGGNFTQYSGNTQKYFIKLNSDCTKDTSYKYQEVITMIDLSNNPNLSSLYLSSCNMDKYHPSLSGLTKLSTLNMNFNNFTNFPDTSNLSALTSLDVNNNDIRGNIPDYYINNTKLYDFDFGTNELTGEIPEYLGTLTSLRYLELPNNKMSGSLPKFFSGLTTLTSIDVSNNKFTDGIEYLSGKTNISKLDLSYNSFSGKTLFDMRQFKSFYYMNMSYCGLCGELLLDQDTAINIQTTNFKVNNLIGNIPPISSTYKSSSYHTYDVSYNYFTGYTSMSGSQHYAYILLFQNNYLPTIEINKVLSDANKCYYNNGTLNISGPNMSSPTGQGLIDVDNLISKGWTVTTTPLSVENMGFNKTVYNTTIDLSGNCYVGGMFTEYNKQSIEYLLKLNSGGTLYESYGTGLTFSNLNIQNSILDSNGKLIICGSFSLNGSIIDLVKLNVDGTIDTSFNTSNKASNSVWSVVIDSSGKTYAGGDLTYYDTNSAGRLVRINSGGTYDSSYNTSTGFNSSVRVMVIDNNDRLYVGGDFTTYNSISKNYFIKLNNDASVDTTFNSNTNFNNNIKSLKLDESNNKIYVGGNFTSYSGVSYNRLIRLNTTDASIDTSFIIGSGFSDTVYSIVQDSEGKIYVGGNFTTFSGTTQKYMVKLNSDGSKDTSFNIGSGFNGTVYDIKIDSNGKLLVSGDFYLYNGKPHNRLVKLNTDGTVNTSFDIGDTNIYTVDSLSNRLTFMYTGIANTSSYINVSGINYVIVSNSNYIIWDCGGSGEYTFTSFTTITRNLNGTNFTIQYISGTVSSNNCLFKIKISS